MVRSDKNITTMHTKQTLLASSILITSLPVRAELDLNGDGMSDLWQALHGAQNLSPNADTDGDGINNRDESIAGTNPFSASSKFELKLNKGPNSQINLSWSTVSGKSYQLRKSSDLKTWVNSGSPVIGNGTLFSQAVSPVAPKEFWEVAVSDIDADLDGLEDYEEQLLGYSDGNAFSSSSSTGNDFVSALNLFGSPATFDFQGQSTTGTPPSLAESSRFLQQATMGATYDAIVGLSNTGIPVWIESQFALPATSHVATNNAISRTFFEQETGDDVTESLYRWTWWNTALNAPDGLRQRVAFALSEILVIAQTTDELEDFYWGVATYYDILVNNAFGNYRDILMEVSTNPAMGHYLSHAKNRPTDAANNIFPDENYTREVMQLFSIGLYELNLDGSRRKDPQSNDIPTYNNTDITNFAKVFTGLTYNPENPNNGTPYFNEVDFFNISDTSEYLAAQAEWMGIAMLPYEPMHEQGIKNLLYGQTTNGNIQEDLDAAIDNLFNHPNTGPFVGRLLIQRLVTSNPSPAYISRVATAFNDNGNGVRGDMKAVIRAILLDPEARNRSMLNDPKHGKLREPVLRHTHLARAFRYRRESGTFRVEAQGPSGWKPSMAPKPTARNP